MTITYQNRLPDPSTAIGNAGQVGGTAGPGFASMQLTSSSPVMQTRTNSGRLVSRSVVGHKWSVAINYNPMTREEFEPIQNFLLNTRGGLKAFFLSLPQNNVPQLAAFATYAAANLTNILTNTKSSNLIPGNSYKINTVGTTNFVSIGAENSSVGTVFTATGAGAGSGTVIATAGSTSIMADGFGSTAGRDPRPGDMFTISDANDTSHLKMYKVTQVETNAVYNSTQPATAERIIHFMPGLQKQTLNNSVLNFHNPLMRVVLASDVQQYDLNTNNLYSFSLKLEEAQS